MVSIKECLRFKNVVFIYLLGMTISLSYKKYKNNNYYSDIEYSKWGTSRG